MNELNLNERNKQLVILMQALWGAISPNIRMIAFSSCDPIWKIQFVLERDDAEDREDIEDAAFEFGALQETGSVRFEVEVIVSSAPLPRPEHPWIGVYRRKELI